MVHSQGDFDRIDDTLRCLSWHKVHETACACSCTKGHTQARWAAMEAERAAATQPQAEPAKVENDMTDGPTDMEVVAVVGKCGQCAFWMCSRLCPRERNVGGMSRGPSVNAHGCGKFKLERVKPQAEPTASEGKDAHDPLCDTLELGPDLGPSTKPCNCKGRKTP